MRADLKAIVAAAVTHFCSDRAKLNAEVSAAGIMADLRRMGVTIIEAKFVSVRDSNYLTDALVTLNEKITGLPEFQDSTKGALPASHPAINEIIEAEQYMLRLCGRPQH